MSLIREFLEEEDGIGIVEIILILVILIGLVVLFKKEITSIVKKALQTFTKDSKNIIGQ